MSKNISDAMNDLFEYFEANGISYKKAYPNYDYYNPMLSKRDTSKWLVAIKEIFYSEKNGIDRKTAIRSVTNGWNITEIQDFLNWLKFYEEGSHLKYKFAQLWYENGSPGYFLHVKKEDEETSPTISNRDIDFAKDSAESKFIANEKKHIIEKQRNKLISRLDSVEKLLRTQDGHSFAGEEYESLIDSIYQLKKKISLINKISLSTKLYEDIIIREGNVLSKKGFKKAAGLMYSFADDPLNPASAPPPTQSEGVPGGLPSMGPGAPQTYDGDNNSFIPKQIPEGIAGFLRNLETAQFTSKKDIDESDDINVSDDFIVEAQVANESLEVTEESSFDKRFDSVMSNLKIEDVVNELEDLAKIFKTRELPRRLAKADMMLDSLGLASFFPSLSEAQNKALESNNYISTRIEDIISKLRGSIKTNEIDLIGDEPVQSPEVSAIKNNLEQESELEKERKKIRKEQENKSLEVADKETPEINVQEELNTVGPTPASVATPAPKPISVQPQPLVK